MRDTPTEAQKRDASKAGEEFAKGWEIVHSPSPKVRRKSRGRLGQLKDYVWAKRYRVYALYWFAKYEYQRDHEKHAPFDFPIKSDNMGTVPGVPTKYALDSKWSIPDEDLKYLVDGPLVRPGIPPTILVPASVSIKMIRQQISAWVKSHPILSVIMLLWPVVEFFATIRGAIGG
ncbi:MAG: hypothetical protein V7742_11395 [Halioglobus sp.]